jgi:hypothetical protein
MGLEDNIRVNRQGIVSSTIMPNLPGTSVALIYLSYKTKTNYVA